MAMTPPVASASWRVWLQVVAAFTTATLVQLFLYAGPSHLARGTPWLPAALYTPYVLFFIAGPALLATVFAVLRVRRHDRANGRQATGFASGAALTVLALLSAYLGVFVAFNTWGT
jgi:hypothetical protein